MTGHSRDFRTKGWIRTVTRTLAGPFTCTYLLAGSDINTCTSVPQRFGIHSVQDLVNRTFKDV